MRTGLLAIAALLASSAVAAAIATSARGGSSPSPKSYSTSELRVGPWAKEGRSATAKPGEANLIRAIERTRLRALVEANMTVARRLHAASFQLINPAGSALSRFEYLDSVAKGFIDYRKFEPASAVAVRVYGSSAVIRYRSNIDIVVRGDRLTHQAWHTDVYERRDGRWQVVWSQATAIPS